MVETTSVEVPSSTTYSRAAKRMQEDAEGRDEKIS
jgi:hypothetical protein